jgi:hypothetical protein
MTTSLDKLQGHLAACRAANAAKVVDLLALDIEIDRLNQFVIDTATFLGRLSVDWEDAEVYILDYIEREQARQRPPAPIAQSVADLHHLAERTGEHVGRGDE